MNNFLSQFQNLRKLSNFGENHPAFNFEAGQEVMTKTITLKEKCHVESIDIEIDARIHSQTDIQSNIIRKELNQVGAYLSNGMEPQNKDEQEFIHTSIFQPSQQQQNSTKPLEENKIYFDKIQARTQRKRQAKGHKSNYIDYLKNIPAYIIKKAMKIIFSIENRTNIERYCDKWGVSISQFISFYEQLFPIIYGPNSIIRLFKSTQNDVVMKKMFAQILRKVLRQKYLLTVLREGRMDDLKSYIEYKNKYLMYFDSLLKK